ncbi:rhodanese-like domain-containing protein [Bdellovibrio sp. NC01]|uniref:rhodanese-like domain-containing protein n=1 Tax=Bdellovibrio sp. NC01 TaxID=2220073 RepID=UPI00143E04FA|nr:rhodanese-like domain-containing protein [Bdellovibrio sp. NC01]
MRQLFFFLCIVLFVGVVSAKEVWLDVRTAKEYSEGHIPAAINYDVLKQDFAAKVSKLSREDSYKVYCKGGKRAAQAVTIMQDNGFKDVTNIGGYEDAQRVYANP